MTNSNAKNIEAVEQLLSPAIEGQGCELVYLEIQKAGSRSVLRLYIDKEGGVSIGDCERISREVEPILDAEEVFPGRYILEVSSPGVDRPLHRLRDFVRFVGEEARIELSRPLSDGSRRLRGWLAGVEGETIQLRLSSGQVVSVKHSEIKKANTIWNGESPRRDAEEA